MVSTERSGNGFCFQIIKLLLGERTDGEIKRVRIKRFEDLDTDVMK